MPCPARAPRRRPGQPHLEGTPPPSWAGFRNIQANPNVRVYLASRKPTPAIAHRLDADTSAASLGRYAAAHPRSWATLRPVLEQTLGTRINIGGTALPLIALDLTEQVRGYFGKARLVEYGYASLGMQ